MSDQSLLVPSTIEGPYGLEDDETLNSVYTMLTCSNDHQSANHCLMQVLPTVSDSSMVEEVQQYDREMSATPLPDLEQIFHDITDLEIEQTGGNPRNAPSQIHVSEATDVVPVHVLETTDVAPVRKKAINKRTQKCKAKPANTRKGTKNGSPASHALPDYTMQKMIETCQSTPNFTDIHRDQSGSRTMYLQLVAQIAEMLRPSYPSEPGKRGTLKSELNEAVQVQIHLDSNVYSGPVSVVVIGACLLEKTDGVKNQPNFLLRSATDLSSGEIVLDGIKCACYRKVVTSGEIIDMEFRIERPKGMSMRTLVRYCQIVFRICILEQTVSGEWNVSDYAQLVSNTFTIDQTKGPPTIESSTHIQCDYKGNVNCTVKGKNLCSQKSPQDVSVTFRHERSQWEAKAKIFDVVTSDSNLTFVIPRFEPQYLAEYRDGVKVQVIIIVDKKPAKDVMDFTYTFAFEAPGVLGSAQPSLNVNIQPMDAIGYGRGTMLPETLDFASRSSFDIQSLQ